MSDSACYDGSSPKVPPGLCEGPAPGGKKRDKSKQAGGGSSSTGAKEGQGLEGWLGANVVYIKWAVILLLAPRVVGMVLQHLRRGRLGRARFARPGG